MRVAVYPCKGVRTCCVCGQEREGCTTEKAFIHPTCSLCVEEREMLLAAVDDLQKRLRIVMRDWLSYWGAFIPQDKLIGDDFSFADKLITGLTDELLVLGSLA